jgi:hypothetical protein
MIIHPRVTISLTWNQSRNPFPFVGVQIRVRSLSRLKVALSISMSIPRVLVLLIFLVDLLFRSMKVRVRLFLPSRNEAGKAVVGIQTTAEGIAALANEELRE